jgi:hypothetical protein
MTRLRHLEQSAADPVTIANAHRVAREAVDGEVLPELPEVKSFRPVALPPPSRR